MFNTIFLARIEGGTLSFHIFIGEQKRGAGYSKADMALNDNAI